MARKRTPKLESIHSALLCLAIALSSMALGAVAAQAQTFTTLFSFNGSDGANPYASLCMDSAGNVYGTTQGGGQYGYGTVFKLDTSGNETVLYSFTGGIDGRFPQAGLVLDKAGPLYGTTAAGGANGDGTVFKVDTCGYETVLHNFGPQGNGDGRYPSFGSLVVDTTGNLYGTTAVGGGSEEGVVFKVDGSGNETVLYSFSGGADGLNPYGGLIMDAQGNLYGTTAGGGANGWGTVFKLDTSGNKTVLHSFTGVDGGNPSASLVADTAGKLYGTTACCSFGYGAVFKLDTSGSATVLHTFAGGSDGTEPAVGALVMDTAGNLYGTTFGGGAYDQGIVFKVDTSGNETVLHSFPASTGDGAGPHGGLMIDAAGNLYGTTYGGGASSNCPVGTGCGTVFKLAAFTPQQATQATITSVNALYSQGVLNKGQDNSLVKHLQHAINLMNAGKNAGAIGNLDSFISEVNDLLRSGVLSPFQAEPLIGAAESVIAQIS